MEKWGWRMGGERGKRKKRGGEREHESEVSWSLVHISTSCPAVYHHSQVRVSCSLACDALCVCVCPVLMPAAVTKVKTRVAFLLLRFPPVPLYRNLPTLLFCRFDVSLTNNAAVLKSFNTCATLNSYLTISPSSHSFLTLNSVRVVFAFACDWNARFLTSSCSASSLRLHNCSPCKWQKSRKLFSLALQSPWFYCVSLVLGADICIVCWMFEKCVSFDTELKRANRGRFALGQCHAASGTTAKCRVAEMHTTICQNFVQGLI